MLKFTWIIPLLPFLSFLGIFFLGKKLPQKGAFLGIASVGISFILSLVVLFEIISGKPVEQSIPWIILGKYHIELGILVDNLTSIMLLVVTFVSLLVHIYSLSYMHGEKRFKWYYAVLSLFTASMLILILSNNLLQLYMGWELIGLCSYLLIGFWYEKPSASNAAKKAFLTTRVGDVGFFIGMTILFINFGTFNFHRIIAGVESGAVSSTIIMWSAIFLFCGSIGKSAQFPLYMWLPDAMEGPTPVSALIHAATLVAAGVYLVGRNYLIFESAPASLTVVAIIGAITMLPAAGVALFMNDIKKILAYSTISQLGYMMVGLGVGGYTAGIFHLMTHAFFKALLFLGSGSIIHAVHTQDIREMGGLYKKMKITATTFIIGSLSLAGIPPLSGFWSKDEILLEAFRSGNYIIFAAGEITAFLTAFYMTRLCVLTFFGKFKGKNHPHESPYPMTIPLILLSVLAIFVGLAGSPLTGHAFGKFISLPHPESVEPSLFVMGLSILMAVSGILLGIRIYGKEPLPEVSLKPAKAENKKPLENVGASIGFVGSVFHFLDRSVVDRLFVGGVAFLIQKFGLITYWFDSKIFDNIFVNGFAFLTTQIGKIAYWFDSKIIDNIVNASAFMTMKGSFQAGWFDSKVVDGAVNLVGGATKKGGRGLRITQTGFLQSYGLMFVTGSTLLFLFIILWIVYFGR